jgi:hypothetical protein
MPPSRRVAALLALLPGMLSAPAAGDVAPGDVVTAANHEVVRDLLPAEFYSYAVEGFEDLEMQIVESGEYPVAPEYVEATVKYACQASLDERGNLVNYTAGQPFPYSEWAKEATGHACDLEPDDPEIGLKLAWNVNFRWQGGSGFTRGARRGASPRASTGAPTSATGPICCPTRTSSRRAPTSSGPSTST